MSTAQDRYREREQRSAPSIERCFLGAAERQKADALQSAQVNLEEAMKRIGALEAHIRVHDADSGWNNYRNLMNRIEGLAREIVALGGGPVLIPVRMERAPKRSVAVDESWLETTKPEDDQPLWNRSEEGRRKHKLQLKAFAEMEQNKRRMAITGQGG